MADFSGNIIPETVLLGEPSDTVSLYISTVSSGGPSSYKIFGMRGYDPGALVYRSWVVLNTPDYAGAQYVGPGAGTLTSILVTWETLSV